VISTLVYSPQELQDLVDFLTSDIERKKTDLKEISLMTSNTLEYCVEMVFDVGKILCVFSQRQKAYFTAGLAFKHLTKVFILSDFSITVSPRKRLFRKGPLIKTNNHKLTEALLNNPIFLDNLAHLRRKKLVTEDNIQSHCFPGLKGKALLFQVDEIMTDKTSFQKVTQLFIEVLVIFNQLKRS
jgi:hypothetical protein